jgi:hypothetical protein
VDIAHQRRQFELRPLGRAEWTEHLRREPRKQRLRTAGAVHDVAQMARPESRRRPQYGMDDAGAAMRQHPEVPGGAAVELFGAW